MLKDLLLKSAKPFIHQLSLSGFWIKSKKPDVFLVIVAGYSPLISI